MPTVIRRGPYMFFYSTQVIKKSHPIFTLNERITLQNSGSNLSVCIIVVDSQEKKFLEFNE